MWILTVYPQVVNMTRSLNRVCYAINKVGFVKVTVQLSRTLFNTYQLKLDEVEYTINCIANLRVLIYIHKTGFSPRSPDPGGQTLRWSWSAVCVCLGWSLRCGGSARSPPSASGYRPAGFRWSLRCGQGWNHTGYFLLLEEPDGVS